MTDQRSGEPAATLAELRSLLGSEARLDTVLSRLACMTARVVPGGMVSITVLTDGPGPGTRTVAATADAVIAIDAGQYRNGEGPGPEAVRRRCPVRVEVDELGDRWPAFAASARRAGVRSCLSVPLFLDDAPVLGAMNVHGRQAHAADRLDDVLLGLLTTAAVTAILTDRRCTRVRRLAEAMVAELDARVEIDQAVGVLMARHRIPPKAAAGLLTGRARDAGVAPRDLARALLGSLSRGPGGGRWHGG